MADNTPKYFLEEDIPNRVKAKPEVLKSLNAVVEFQIGGPNGGTWAADFTEAGGGKVVAGNATNPKCTCIMSDEVFVGIMTKKTNSQMAFMSGKLKIKGDMGTAMKLTKVLG